MPQLFTNNARALLVSGITDASTSLTVEAGKADLFPPANVGTGAVPSINNWFKVTLQDGAGNVEIIYVRTRAAGSAIMSNLIRGQEGTTARSFGAGTVVGLRITALDIETSISLGVNAVSLTGNQNIDGVKTFNANPISAAAQSPAANSLTRRDFVLQQVGTLDAATVKLAGDQTIEGTKTFSTAPVVGTAAAKTANSSAASTAFVDRLRSLVDPATSGTGTLVAGDRGSIVEATGGITVPASVFAKNDVVSIVNTTSGNITLTQGAGLTLHQVGTANTGNRTIAQRGMVTIAFVSPTVAYVSGGGLS